MAQALLKLNPSGGGRLLRNTLIAVYIIVILGIAAVARSQDVATNSTDVSIKIKN